MHAFSHLKPREIRTILLAKDLLAHIEELITPYGTSPLFVVDSNTQTFLTSLPPKALLVKLSAYVKADHQTIEYLRTASQRADLLVAIGSGTINDLCKYVSFLTHKKYISFPTAPSINGYATSNASLTIHGYKVSKHAHLPQAIYADLTVLTNSPKRLIISGIADLLCRSTIIPDCILGHLLFGVDDHSNLFTILAELEKLLLQDLQNITAGQEQGITLLFQALLISGFCMHIAGTSSTASQGEHQIAHTLEMMRTTDCFHGEQIAVTTLTMAKLQKELLKITKPRLNNFVLSHNKYYDCFGTDLGNTILHNFCAIPADKIIPLLEEKWLSTRERINSMQVLSEKELYDILSSIKAPTTYQDIEYTIQEYRDACNLAFAIRNRFTFLNLAHYMNYII